MAATRLVVLAVAVIAVVAGCVSPQTAIAGANRAANRGDVEAPAHSIDGATLFGAALPTVATPTAVTSTLYARDGTVFRGPVDVPPGIASELSRLLTDRDVLEVGGPPDACKTFFGFGVDFYGATPTDHVDVRICLNCAQVSVRNNGAEAGSAALVGVDARLENLARSVFPAEAQVDGN